MPLRSKPPAPPEDLRRSDATIAGERYVIVSFASSPAPRLPGLTPAESAVVRLAASGLENVEIAAARGVSTTTVQNQLARAFRKLRVASRAEALAWLIARGLGPPSL